jgi:hypothetical protein
VRNLLRYGRRARLTTVSEPPFLALTPNRRLCFQACHVTQDSVSDHEKAFKLTPDDLSALEIIAANPAWDKSRQLLNSLGAEARRQGQALIKKAQSRPTVRLKP